MKRTNVEEIIELMKSEVESRVDFDKLDYDVDLTDQNIDSLDISTLFLAIEEKFEIEINDEDIDNNTTINKIVNFINNK
jgi:acyl carrier protein